MNTLYIYPESVNFTKHKDSNNKNIALKVRFKENDDDPNGDGSSVRFYYILINYNCLLFM